MGLEQIKELIKDGKVIFVEDGTRTRMQVNLDKLNEADNYKVVEIHCGVMINPKGIYPLNKVPEVVKRDPHITYNLIPVKDETLPQPK